MSNIDYKADVKKYNPFYCYVYFENSIMQHHIRHYSEEPPYCKTIGASCISEKKAWQNAYEQLKKEGKI